MAVAFPATFFAQADTLSLPVLEVFDSLQRQNVRSASLYFDSMEYSRNKYLDAGEFLQLNSGIYVKDYGPGSISTMAYRGTSANHTRIFWDGISVDNIMLGQSDLSLFSFGRKMRADFIKGGASLALGSGGIGGILNIEPGSERVRGIALDIAPSYGSYNTRMLPASVTYGRGRWEFGLNLSVTSSDNDFEYEDEVKGRIVKRENAAFERKHVMPEITYYTKGGEVSASLWTMRSYRQNPAAIGSSHGNSFQEDSWDRLFLKWRHGWGKKAITVRSMTAEEYLYYENEMLNIHSENRVSYLKNQAELKIRISPKFLSETQIRADMARANSVNYDGIRETNTAGFCQGFTSEGRYQKVHVNLRAESGNGRQVYFTPSVFLSVNPISSKPNSAFFGEVASNVRMPSFNEMFWQDAGKEDLKAERSASAEVGIDQSIKTGSGEGLRILLSVFRAEIDNLIVWRPENSVWRPFNVRALRNQGLEAELKSDITAGELHLDLHCGYSYTSSEISEDEQFPEAEGRQQVYVPLHKLFGTAVAEWKRYFISYNQVYTGEVYTSTDNSSSLQPSYPAVLETGMKFKAGSSSITLEFTVKNLYNESYRYVAMMPMPGRNYCLTIIYLLNQIKS